MKQFQKPQKRTLEQICRHLQPSHVTGLGTSSSHGRQMKMQCSAKFALVHNLLTEWVLQLNKCALTDHIPTSNQKTAIRAHNFERMNKPVTFQKQNYGGTEGEGPISCPHHRQDWSRPERLSADQESRQLVKVAWPEFVTTEMMWSLNKWNQWTRPLSTFLLLFFFVVAAAVFQQSCFWRSWQHDTKQYVSLT